MSSLTKISQSLLPQTSPPPYLLSQRETERFLDPKKEIEKIISYSKTPEAQQDILPTTGRECFVSLFKLPYLLIQVYALRCLAGVGVWRKQCTLLSLHKRADAVAPPKRFTIESTSGIQTRFLETTRNMHRLDTGSFFLQPDVDLAGNQNPYLKKAWTNGYDGKTKKFRFFSGIGLCAGINQRFLELYFKTRNHIKDPKVLAKSVTHLFKEGANEQAAFLHNYLDPPRITLRAIQALKGTPSSKKLSPGIYHISLLRILSEKESRGHCIVLIKQNDLLSFLFDSNFGIVQLQSKDNCDPLEELMTLPTYSNRKIDTHLIERTSL